MLVKIELSNRLAQIVSALLNLSNNQVRNRLSFSRLGLRDAILAALVYRSSFQNEKKAEQSEG